MPLANIKHNHHYLQNKHPPLSCLLCQASHIFCCLRHCCRVFAPPLPTAVSATCPLKPGARWKILRKDGPQCKPGQCHNAHLPPACICLIIQESGTWMPRRIFSRQHFYFISTTSVPRSRTEVVECGGTRWRRCK